MPTKLTTIAAPLVAGLSLAAAVIVAGPALADQPAGDRPTETAEQIGALSSTPLLRSTTTERPQPSTTALTSTTILPQVAVEPPPDLPALADDSSAPSPADPPATHPLLPATEATPGIPAVASTAGSASYARSNKGHRLWLDIRFDFDEYQNVVVDWGDGTKETLVDHLTVEAAHVATDGTLPPPPSRWRTDHTYDLTLIPIERPVTITWIGPSASDIHFASFTMTSVAVFDLTFHPLTFTAEASCDWHSKGDFTVTWDQGLGWYTTPEFELGKGESQVLEEFSFTRGGLTAETFWSEVLAMRMKEHDNLGSSILGYFPPNRWLAEFDGVPPTGHGGPRVVQELADHTVTVTNRRELGHECHVRVRFDATLDLYEG